ncbi:MAG: hypothetical protein FWF79_07135 [Defluviitaleaceae bacterium]|nr:hypothetical protein [Defluviitaleaceae bacterium]
MGDVFNEQIVKRQSSVKDTAIKVCLWIIALFIGFTAFLFLGSMGFGAIGFLVIFAAGYAAVFFSGYLKVEYEYAFTSGELDIDAIYDRSRRKRLMSVKVSEFEIMAHIDDKAHEHSFSTAQATLDYSSGVTGPATYVFLTTYNSKKTKVIIEPNDKMLKAISGAITRRKLHLRPGVVLI